MSSFYNLDYSKNQKIFIICIVKVNKITYLGHKGLYPDSQAWINIYFASLVPSKRSVQICPFRNMQQFGLVMEQGIAQLVDWICFGVFVSNKLQYWLKTLFLYLYIC